MLKALKVEDLMIREWIDLKSTQCYVSKEGMNVGGHRPCEKERTDAKVAMILKRRRQRTSRNLHILEVSCKKGRTRRPPGQG